MENTHVQRGILKPTLILTTLLFLLVAPVPDSRDIADMTANFMVPNDHYGLLASAEPVKSEKEASEQ